jgi:hypothetical protein
LTRNSALELIRDSQREWALKRSIQFDLKSQTTSLENNLFQPLHPRTREDFTAGKGAELGDMGLPGKMWSLISSSALACNVFDPWRDRPLGELAAALGIDSTYRISRFEATHKTGFGGIPPHLDVELSSKAGRVVAVESKFTEPYRPVTNAFRPSYFSNPQPWRHLPTSLEMARALVAGDVEFRFLHAAQLIKHALGLTRSHGPQGFDLVYLWYRPPGSEGDATASEFDLFHAMLGNEFSLRAITYQDLLNRVTGGPEGWLQYVKDRYLPGSWAP